jgi:membrane fusion protein (multidrug efflux system)
MLRHALLAAVLIAGPAAAQPAPPAQSVGVVTASLQPVTQGLEFVGRVEAIGRVEIHARVTGYLEAVDFTEGAMVHEGDKLFEIEQGPFQAAVLQAQGALVQAEGQRTNAILALKRAEELVKTSATSVAVRDERRAAEQSAQGAVITAEANLRTAGINLGYTIITAPIAGKIGRTNVTKGNVVGPQSGVLATIVSQDPMYVAFPVSQREFLRLQQEGTKADGSTALVRIRFADGSTYPQQGKIDFVDVQVDRATDTVAVRATVANPDGTLVDGQFVRVRVEADKPQEFVVIPSAALVIDQQGPYVFVVQDGKAVVRRLKLGQDLGRTMVVTEGLKGGEQVVVDGIATLRPGAAVVAGPSKGI